LIRGCFGSQWPWNPSVELEANRVSFRVAIISNEFVKIRGGSSSQGSWNPSGELKANRVSSRVAMISSELVNKRRLWLPGALNPSGELEANQASDSGRSCLPVLCA